MRFLLLMGMLPFLLACETTNQQLSTPHKSTQTTNNYYVTAEDLSLAAIPKPVMYTYNGDKSAESRTAVRIMDIMQRTNIQPRALTPELSQQMAVHLLNQLDPDNLYFTTSQADRFIKNNADFATLFATGEIDTLITRLKQLQDIQQQRYTATLTAINEGKIVNNNYLYRDHSKRFESESSIKEYRQDERVKEAQQLQQIPDGGSTSNDKHIARYHAFITHIEDQTRMQKFAYIARSFIQTYDARGLYLEKKDAKNRLDKKQLSGIGVYLEKVGDSILIKRIFPGSPAATSTLKAGDEIIAIAAVDQSWQDMKVHSITTANQLVMGEKNSEVSIAVAKRGSANVEFMTLKRDRVQLHSTEIKLITNSTGQKIAYLKPGSFYVGIAKDIEQQVQKIPNFYQYPLIIDLLSNGGGALSEATNVAGLFLPNSDIIQLRGANNRVQIERTVTEFAVIQNKTITVLINKESAGSAEILAAALQDYAVATIVGGKSYGLGTAAQHRSLKRIYDKEDRGSMQHSIAQYYRVNGDSFQGRGVMPDVKVTLTENLDAPVLNHVSWNKVRDISPSISANQSNRIATIQQSVETKKMQYSQQQLIQMIADIGQ